MENRYLRVILLTDGETMKNWQERQFSQPNAARQGAAQGGAA
jgi:hypothetical protein